MSSTISIRKEINQDHTEVNKIIKEAFASKEMSDHQEHLLVDRIRKSPAFIPELSLVAELNHQIVGHVILTKIKIVNNHDIHESLALAPVSVLPEHQNKGVGGQLILAAHEKAKSLGFTSVVLLGHDQYYPRFGYQQAKTFGITLPFDVPDENCMAIELIENALHGVQGTVEYLKEFYE